MREQVRDVGWRYPEWWCLALAAAAWAALVGRALVAPSAHHELAWAEQLAAWLIMVVAMMLPLAAGPLRLTALASLWYRRDRAMAGFAIGFLGPWLAAGALVTAAEAELTRALSARTVAFLACALFACAAIWQLAPVKRRALVSCHQLVPLRPRGWSADRDCVRFGWKIGAACLTSCWLLMLACVFAGHELWAMLAACAIGLAERYPARPLRRSTFSVLIGIACVYGVLALAT